MTENTNPTAQQVQEANLDTLTGGENDKTPDKFQPLLAVLPPAEASYLQEIVNRLRQLLGKQLLGVYLFGSAGYGAYEVGLSDLDVQAVVAEPLSPAESLKIAHSLSQQELPCPAVKLEFVCYALAKLGNQPRFELNLNTGRGKEDHITLDPTQEASHWFILDIALGRELGYALYGPTPTTLFPAVPRLVVLQAIRDSLDWHSENELTSANSVLNACRGWRYSETGEFGSKLAGAQWAGQKPACPPVVKEALLVRQTSATLPPQAVQQLYAEVRLAVQQALAALSQN